MNRGIIETIEHGVVTSTSLLVNMPACDDAIRCLRELQGRGATASVGLHFNIVAGRPLASCPTLIRRRTGQFLPLRALAWRAFARRLELRDVERELEAQLERAAGLLASLGARVTHIDSHRHAHCLPGVLDVVLAAARRSGISHVRHPYETSSALLTHIDSHRHAHCLPGVLDVVLAAARRSGISHVRHPYETSSALRRTRSVVASRILRAVLGSRAASAMDDVAFTGLAAMASRTFERDLLELVSALPPGTTELMVHPGYDSPELAALDPYRAPREREVRALTSRALRDRIRARGVELTRFDAPPAPPSTAVLA